jgi:hypothetical protein
MCINSRPGLKVIRFKNKETNDMDALLGRLNRIIGFLSTQSRWFAERELRSLAKRGTLVLI